jgi:hypothetical protein
MKIDQRIHPGGERRVVTVIPECRAHGTEPVVQVEEGLWRCAVCDTEIELVDGELIRLAPSPWEALAVI